MVDFRSPIEVTVPGGKALMLSMEWTGKRGPVLTGDESAIDLVVQNTDTENSVKGSVILDWYFFPPWQGLQVHSTHSVPFEAKPGSTRRMPVPKEWLFTEGKGYYVFRGCSVIGPQTHGVIPLDHPMCAFTVLERSEWEADQTRISTTLAFAFAAALGSVVAAVASLALAGVLHL